MDQAEQLRKLVQNKERPPQIARVITVTSGKGGVGKSSISVNLAIQFRRLGKRVVILDADFGLANVEVMLGIRPQFNLADLMFRGKTLPEIITAGPEDIGFISGGSGIQELSKLTKEQMVYLTQMLVELDRMADIIIIDTGAGIADNVLEFVTACSEVLLVATPEPTSITDAYALLKTLNRKSEFSKERTSIKMVANRVRSDSEGKNLYEKMSVVVNRFLNIQPEYLGMIPQDDCVSKAIMQQQPVTLAFPNAASTKAFEAIAYKLVNGTEPEEKKGITALFSNLIRSKLKLSNQKK